MSKIKFRVWDKNSNIMYSPKCLDLLIHLDGKLQSFDEEGFIKGTENTPQLEILRYSGFLDQDKTEICEGDIIELVNEDGEKIRVVCEFGSARRDIYGNLVEIIGFYFRRLSDDRKTFPIVNNYLGKHDTEIFKIIGNIYENPKLLEEI